MEHSNVPDRMLIASEFQVLLFFSVILAYRCGQDDLFYTRKI